MLQYALAVILSASMQKRTSGAQKMPVGPAIGNQLLQLSASGFQLLCNAADKVFSAESEMVLFDLQY
jgi:hypothetical protein